MADDAADREAEREWAREDWLIRALPRPAWNRYASRPDGDLFDERLLADAVEATRASLRFLTDAGMRPMPDRKGTGYSERGVLLGWSGDTVCVVAALESEGTLGLLVVKVGITPPTLAALIDRARRTQPVLVPFGAFWLTGRDGDAVDDEIEGYLSLFHEALGHEPQTVDLALLDTELRAQTRRLAVERQVPWLRAEAEHAWRAGDWARYLTMIDVLPDLEPEDRERRDHASAQLADMLPPPAWPPTVDGIRLAASRSNEARVAIERGTASSDLLWLAQGRMVTDELADAMVRLRTGDPTAVEPALMFLEADPWAFRTGYLKGRIMARLRRCPLDAGQQARLRTVLLHLVDVGFRMEFREACRLAWRVADPAFMHALRARVSHPDWRVAKRAQVMLAAIRPPAGT